MRQTYSEDMDRILDLKTSLELTVNDLRILITSLDALVYFEKEDGEEYLDDDGLALRARLRAKYAAILKKEPAEN